jgi:cytochrome c oxidase subunit 4
MHDHDHHPSAAHGPVTRVGETADDTVRHAEASHDSAGHEHHAHGGIGKYLLVFLALCVLTTMSFSTYSAAWPWKDQPQVGWAFMMAISCTKALLVVLFSMHILWEANWKYVLTIPAAMMAIFLAIMLIPDIGMRNRMVSQERALHMARTADLRLLEEAGAAAAAAPAH